jgi:hypothetical protein
VDQEEDDHGDDEEHLHRASHSATATITRTKMTGFMEILYCQVMALPEL